MTPHPTTPPESQRSPPRRLLAVVGTDTGVGKTVVAAGLIHGLRLAGLNVAAFKPVETGLVNGMLSGGLADWQRLAAVSGQAPDSCLGASFALPAAPLAAAREAGREIHLSDLTEQLQALADHRDLVVVEGAGGLCVPFAKDLLWADVIQQWSPECLVVGRLGLGTVNHTLLTLDHLARRKITVLGVILNTLTNPGAETTQTPGLIEEFGGAIVCGVIPEGCIAQNDVAGLLAGTGLMERLTSRYKND
jgi:dethiobiotin synthetase